MSIRAAQIRDITAIYRVLCSVIAEQEFLMSLQKPDLPMFTRFIEANLKRGNPVWIAQEGQQTVGWCDVYPRGADVQRHVGRVGMGVAAEYRGKGHGKAMLAATIQSSWQAGFTRLELEVFTTNRSAIALYTSMGFVKEGLHRQVRKDSRGYRDTYTMALIKTP
ncbi:MAG: GNAT family N-acetyltransferase [Natronospirillum sp.]